MRSGFPFRQVASSAILPFVFLSAWRPLMAQDASPVGEAVAVVREAFDAIEQKNWARVALLIHPERLTEFKRGEIQQLRWLERAENEPAQVPRDPTMPPAVAEWFEHQAAEHREDYRDKLQNVFGVSSIEELDALSAEEMAIRWLAYNDPEATYRRQLEHELGKLDSIPAAFKPERVPGSRWHRSVIGGAQDSDSVVHVLYRTTYEIRGAPPAGFVGVVAASATRDGWRVWADLGELVGGATGYLPLVAFEARPAASHLDAWVREMAETVVTWPESGPEAGRAYLRGLTPETKRPDAVVIEVRRGGETVRVEIPREAFRALSDLIGPWIFFEP